jgi:curved DNA-binding protein CbpA
MNPYNELDVDPTASQDEIKKKYRKKAKENHPDVGGDPEKMENINKAYALIKDARSREYFDKHGEGQKLNTELAEAINIAMQIINTVIEKNEPDIEFYLSALKQKWQNEFNQNIKSQENLKQKNIVFQKRILKKPDENDFINSFLNERIKAVEFNIEKIKSDWSARCRAFKLLEDYSFKENKQANICFVMTNGPSTSIY